MPNFPQKPLYAACLFVLSINEYAIITSRISNRKIYEAQTKMNETKSWI